MPDRWHLGPMGRRLLAGFLFVSLATLAVHTVGTVVPHLLASSGHPEAVSVEWLVAATVIALGFALVISLVVSVRMATPMRVITGMARAFATGDYSVRVPETGRPEFAELVEALDDAAAEVQRSEAARRRLTDEIAHELRTPLTALQAGLEELRDGLVAPDHEILAGLHDQATRLGRVVDDLSQLAAAESEGLVLSRADVDLGGLVDLAIVAREGPMAVAGLGVVREIDPNVVVRGDADRLHQVTGNLLGNSARYCRPGDWVTVRVRAEGQNGVLEVEDTGPGFGADGLEHAFDRSWRGSAARGTSGSGLGLAIVRALVVAQGGTVELGQGAGGGAVVRIRLPLAPAGRRDGAVTGGSEIAVP
jgi:two-component system sensor histidine kinase BaeS